LCHSIYWDAQAFIEQARKIPSNPGVCWFVIFHAFSHGLKCAHQYDMATAGQKWVFGARERTGGESFDLYHNEITSLNIIIVAESIALKGVFTVKDDPNFRFSSDPDFFSYNKAWMEKLRAKCLHISVGSEQNRSAYFNSISASIPQG
jgi:hypothetical protein